LTAPLITNAYPLFGFEDFGPTDAASLGGGRRHISGFAALVNKPP
jgi:hypothetical protein